MFAFCFLDLVDGWEDQFAVEDLTEEVLLIVGFKWMVAE